MFKSRLILFFIILTVLSGCGKKGPVRPLEEHLPKQVREAQLIQRGEDFQLRWKMPQRNQDGTALTELDHVDVERLFRREEDFCAECPDPWPRVARVHPQLPEPARRIKDLYLLSDSGAQIGQIAHYRLTPRDKQGDMGLPLTIQQAYREPIAAPTVIKVTGHDRATDLSWNEVSGPEGASLLGYQVYRREIGRPYSPVATNMRPIEDTRFTDFNLKNGQHYYYRVRALFDFDGEQVESLPSSEFSAVPNAG